MPCSNTDTKCIVSSRQYHEEEAEGHYVAKIQFLSGKEWSKAFFRIRRPIFLGTAGGGGSSILFFNLFILSDPPNCIMWHNRL